MEVPSQIIRRGIVALCEAIDHGLANAAAQSWSL